MWWISHAQAPYSRFVREQLRRFRHHPRKHVDADRVVRAPDQRRAAAFHGLAHPGKFAQPSRCAAHHRNAQRGQPFDICRRGFGLREFDRHVGSLRRRQIVSHIDARRNGKSGLRRELFEHLPHLAVTHQGQVQANTSGSRVWKNSSCNASVARSRSFRATTNPIFSSDAPCDTMRTLISPRATNTRAATPGV